MCGHKNVLIDSYHKYIITASSVQWGMGNLNFAIHKTKYFSFFYIDESVEQKASKQPLLLGSPLKGCSGFTTGLFSKNTT